MPRFYVVRAASWFAPTLFASDQQSMRPSFAFLCMTDSLKAYQERPDPPFIAGLGCVGLHAGASPLSAQWLDQYELSGKAQFDYYEQRYGFPDGGDFSAAHIPWSLVSKKRLALDPQSTRATATLLGQARIAPPAPAYYLHIFPYGVVTLFTAISAELPSPFDAEKTGAAAQWLSGRARGQRDGPVLHHLGGEFQGGPTDFEEHVRRRVAHSLFRAPDEALLLMKTFVSLHVETPGSNEQATLLLSLLAGEARPERLRGDIRNSQSVFGKYATDRVLLGGGSMVVATEPGQRKEAPSDCSKRRDRHFFWRLVSVVELATNQRIVFDRAIRLLRSAHGTEAREPVRDGLARKRALAIAPQLLGAHENLAAPYRKWYYVVSEETGVSRRRTELADLATDLAKHASEPSTVFNAERITVFEKVVQSEISGFMNNEGKDTMAESAGGQSKYNVTGANAQLTVIEEVFNSTVQNFQNKYIGNSASPDAAKELLALLQLVKESQALPADKKEETIQAIDALGKEVSAPKPNRMMVRGIFDSVKNVVSAAADIAEPAAKVIAILSPLIALI